MWNNIHENPNDTGSNPTQKILTCQSNVVYAHFFAERSLINKILSFLSITKYHIL